MVTTWVKYDRDCFAMVGVVYRLPVFAMVGVVFNFWLPERLHFCCNEAEALCRPPAPLADMAIMFPAFEIRMHLFFANQVFFVNRKLSSFTKKKSPLTVYFT